MGTNDCLSRCHIRPHLLVQLVRRSERVGHNWAWSSFNYHSMYPIARDDGLRPPCLRDPARPHQYGHLCLVWMVGILLIGRPNDGDLMW